MNLKLKTILFSVIFLFVSLQALAYEDHVYQELAKFSQILNYIDTQYVEKVDQEDMFRGSFVGLLQSLDPHSTYMTAEQFRAFNSETKGRFGGLGMEVALKDHVITVVSPIQDSPAWKAGIRAGDKILYIDGKETKNMSLSDSVELMRGPVGRKVTLGIWRSGVRKNITMKRDVIKIIPVKMEDLGNGIAHFTISSFQKGVSKVLKSQIEAYKKENGELKGLVLDLRNNPGGLLPEAVDISDLFLSRGKIVSTKGRFQPTTVNNATKNVFVKVPVVVLINGGSASASEIVAAALKENGRAKLVGTKSFGKGSVQNLFPLKDGAAIKLTVAHYYTPKDNLIDGKGIEPDMEVKFSDYRDSILEQRKKAQEDAKKDQVDPADPQPKDSKEPANNSESNGEEDDITYDGFLDYQVEKALDYLK